MREVSKRPYGARLMNQTSQALVGDIIAVDLPDPIPNSEVKHQQAHGTAGVTLWESRYRRPQSLKPSVESKDSRGLFFFYLPFPCVARHGTTAGPLIVRSCSTVVRDSPLR